MRPKEHLFRQTALEVIELIIDPVALSRGMSSDEAAVGAEEYDFFRQKKKETVAFTSDHLLQRRRSVLDERGKRPPLGAALGFEAVDAPGAVNHLREALGFDWFQQVSDGIGFKRRQRVLIVAGCEDDQRQRHVLGQSLQNLEAVQPRHLYVEKDEVGSQAGDFLQRFKPVAGFADYAHHR